MDFTFRTMVFPVPIDTPMWEPETGKRASVISKYLLDNVLRGGENIVSV